MGYLKWLIFIIGISVMPLQGIWYDVCIDPGHCGDADGGAPGINGSAEPDESDFNLDIALVCYEDLTSILGWSVILTRHDEHYFPKLEPWEKAMIANGKKANDFGERTDFPVSRAVSIHNNSDTIVPGPAHGTETYYSAGNFLSYDFAVVVHNCVWNYLQMFPYAQNRLVKQRGYEFINKCRCVVCLVEVAFVSHYGQWYQLLENQSGFKDWAAYGIDDGITGVWWLHKSPVNLRLVWESYQRGRAKILWHPTETPGVTYSIYRREHPNSNYILINSGISDTTCTDNTLTSDKTYSYYVIAVNGSQTSPRSNILTIHTPVFSSDYAMATGVNNGKRVIFDNSGVASLTYASDTSFWCTRSTDYGNIWSISQSLESGISPSIAIDAINNPHLVGVGCPGLPDTASGEEKRFCVFYTKYTNGIWINLGLYDTSDSILSVSFAIDPLDTGWVVFNTYDGVNNHLMIGKFYTQTIPESLENVTILDTYTGYGKAAIGIRSSDRNIWVVYEKNGTITDLRRNSSGYWSPPHTIYVGGHNPCLSVAGDLIHFIWEVWGTSTSVITCYTNGRIWSRNYTIASGVVGQGCFPYIEKGSVATWQAQSLIGSQWEVYSSKRTISGNWTTPQNISQTSTDSKYPQVAMYQTVPQTQYIYAWTEGNASPYEVKVLATSTASDAMPLYAFDLGEKAPSIFNEHRSGYIIYGSGFEKSVDYDTNFISYRITGLDPGKIYHLGMVFYQDEDNSAWQQGVELDDSLIKTVNLPRKRIIFEKTTISPETYQDSIIVLKIEKVSGLKAVLGAMAVWEFFPENHPLSYVEEFSQNTSTKFTVYTMPNPAKGKTYIHYQLPNTGEVVISIYAISGQLVREIKENRPAGYYTIVWDGKDSKGIDVSNGVYFYHAKSADIIATGKIVLLR